MTGKELADARMGLGLSQEDFAKHLGISRTYLAKNEADKDDVIPHQLEFKVAKAVEMLENRFRIPSLKGLGDLKRKLVEEPMVEYKSTLKELEVSKKHLIPYYDVDVVASPIEVFNEQTMAPTFKIDLPGFADCDFAINVAGHSMYPTIESGTMILCKRIQDKTLIIPGEIYFIVTEDYRMVKRLKKSDKKGWVIAASDNHNGHSSPDGHTYGSVELPLDKILHIYIVKGNIKRHQI